MISFNNVKPFVKLSDLGKYSTKLPRVINLVFGLLNPVSSGLTELCVHRNQTTILSVTLFAIPKRTEYFANR